MDEEQELIELQRLIDDERERQGIAMNLPDIPEYLRKVPGFIRVYSLLHSPSARTSNSGSHNNPRRKT